MEEPISVTVIAEALAQRKDLLNESNDLQTRIVANAVRYEDDDEGDQEDPKELIMRLDVVQAEARKLTVTINEVNNVTRFNFDGENLSLMEAIALRESLLARQRAYKVLAETGKNPYRGYGARTKDEIKQVVKIDTKEMRKRADDAASKVRRLDMEIQKVNWATEI